MSILAIDPGSRESAFITVDDSTRAPIRFGKIPNQELVDSLHRYTGDKAVVEMVASYGMAVGADVFETCVWIGRFTEALVQRGLAVDLITRLPVKMHHCRSAKAKDSNITQALVDRFAPESANHGKGTRHSPGWFYGFSRDVWQAYALAVYAVDVEQERLL